ncbi:MAG TPA: hypothetical protein VIG24_12965 [Acidimicrobiia bacterium]
MTTATDPHHVSASEVPDSMKPIEYWKLQNDISDAVKAGDGVREVKLLGKQQKILRELKKEHIRQQKIGGR